MKINYFTSCIVYFVHFFTVLLMHYSACMYVCMYDPIYDIIPISLFYIISADSMSNKNQMVVKLNNRKTK